MLLEQLKSFVLTVELNSVSKAAEAQYMMQPSISRQLRHLEQQFSSPLFIRSGKKLQLTVFGRMVYDQAVHILQSTDMLLKLHKQYDDQLIVGASLTALPTLLPNIVSSFQARNKTINLFIKTGYSRDIYRMLLEGTIDIGIVSHPTDHPLITTTHLFEDPLLFICSKESTWASFKCMNINSLHGQPIITILKGTYLGDVVNHLLYTNEVIPKIAMEVDNFETAKNMVKAGLGMSILPRSTCISECNRGELHAISFDTTKMNNMDNTSRQMSLIGMGKPLKAAVQNWTEICLEVSRDFA